MGVSCLLTGGYGRKILPGWEQLKAEAEGISFYFRDWQFICGLKFRPLLRLFSICGFSDAVYRQQLDS